MITTQLPSAQEESALLSDLIHRRWSPRAFASRPVDPADLTLVLEAARWAPSSLNEQPWVFLVAPKQSDPEGFAQLLSYLVPANQVWAQAAPVLILIAARTTYARNGRPNRHALYDTGMAAAQLTLQATSLGLVCHQMGGFDPEKARRDSGLPTEVEPIAAMALGWPGDPDQLPEDLRQRELSPRVRRPLADSVFGASFSSTFGEAAGS